MVSVAEQASFERDGFLVVRGLYNAVQMAEISRWTDTVADWPEVPGGGYMMYFEQSRTGPSRRLLNRVENYCPYHRGFHDLVYSAAMQGRVSALLGEPAILFKDKINFKLPGSDGFAPHQDVQAGWERYGSLHLTALLSIDATGIENGCLELAAGQHRRGQIGASWEPLTRDDMRGMVFTPCVTEPGDVVFFDSFVPHRSAPNQTDAPRRVLYVTYNRASEGDNLARYYADKRASYPPDCERQTGREYRFRV